jgi:FkbM family methyltransferase
MSPLQFAHNLVSAVKKKFEPVFFNNKPSQLSWGQAKYHKHLDDVTPKNIRIDGVSFIYEHRHSLFHTYEEIFVREIYRFEAASANPLIIDCGANIGLSILYFKKIYPAARVIGFEPDPHNFHLLQKNLLQNPTLNVSVDLIKKALWTNNNGISFQAEGSEGSKVNEQNTAGSTWVETQDLNELLEGFDYVDFLKVDIEGAENQVIPAAKDQLHKVKNMFLEYHGKTDQLNQLNRLLNLIGELGFSVYMTTADDSIQQPFVQKHSKNNFDVQLNIFCFRP